MKFLFAKHSDKLSTIINPFIVKHEHNRRYKLILEIDFSKGFALTRFVYLSSQSAWRKKMIGRVGEKETGTPLPKPNPKFGLKRLL